MPDATPQPDPQESTEAKLCAYLEGELSPVEKIEIEQHLAANPQHRKLLSDLAKTRDWMRAIPRETSPVDLGEVFQGQVERSMLLDGPVDSDPGMSINRWPQYMVIAAITALALGLGAVLIAVLKNPRPGSYATSQTQGLGHDMPSGGVTLSAEPRSTTGPSADALLENLHPLAVGLGGSTQPSVARVNRMKTAANLPPSAIESETLSDADLIKTRLTSAGIHLSGSARTVCFVVSADTPPLTAEQVRGFFDRHSIAFETNAPVPAYSNRGGVTSSQNGNYTQQGGDHLNNNMVAGRNSNSTGGEKQVAPAPMPPPADTYCVARSMTPLQLELLNASLQSGDLKQSVQRIALPTAAADEAKQVGTPITAPIQKGQTLLVTIPQLSRPTAGTDKTNLVRVAEDGTITLPMIDPLPAAGLMPGDLQKTIADKYREKDLIPDATVTVLGATAPAATQPAAKDSAKNSVGQPTTEPALVDVVVVIERSKFPLPTTVPSPVPSPDGKK